MNTNRKVIWITRTALFLAITIIAQFIGKSIGVPIIGQLFTGILVNMSLIVAGIVVGLSSGCTIAVLSPFLAFLFGMMKLAPAIPVVMVGNLAIVILTALIYKRFSNGSLDVFAQNLLQFVGMVIGAAAKCALMWLSALYILPLFITVPPIIVTSFGIIQAVTGSAGGLLALIIIPSLLKIKRHD